MNNKFDNCLAIINLLQMHAPLTLEEICDLFEDYSINGATMIPRKFYRCKEEIERLLPCRLKCYNKQYELEWDETVTGDSKSGGLWGVLLAQAELAEVTKLMAEMSDKVALLQPPSGEEQLRIVILAMKKKRGITGIYTSRANNEPKSRIWIPLFVALWESRWYMIAECTKHQGSLAVYALERFSNLRLTKTKFEVTSEYKSAQQYFEDQYGVYGPDYKGEKSPMEIKMWVRNNQLPYMQQPLFHHTMKILEEKNGGTIVSFRLVPNTNFYQQILSYGSNVQILSPGCVRDKICELISDMYENYK